MARPDRVTAAPPTVKVMPPTRAEAEAADEHDRGDDQVAGLGQVDLVLHDVAHADRGDHTVEDEAHAADDGRGDGVDERVKLGEKLRMMA